MENPKSFRLREKYIWIKCDEVVFFNKKKMSPVKVKSASAANQFCSLTDFTDTECSFVDLV